jgi:hypothetical protein
MHAPSPSRLARLARVLSAWTTAFPGLVAPGLVALVLLTGLGQGCHDKSNGAKVSPAAELPATARPGGTAKADAAADAAAGDVSGDAGKRPPVDTLPCNEAVCCVGPQCPKRAPGTPCQTADQCETGFCADGVCCNVACQGACVACNQAERMGECLPTASGAPDPHLICRRDTPQTCGQSGVCNGEGGCAKHNAGVPCGEPRCDGPNAMVPPSECDGDGTCVAGTAIACAPFLCEGQGCRATCTDDRQCLAPRICLNGSCGKRGAGQSCSAAEQCESGFCVDGVCCEEACQGRCSTCASARARGKCVLVPAGNADLRALAGKTDPATVCADRGPESCGSNGRCDGKGGCELYRKNTICGPGTCDDKANAAAPPSVCLDGRCERPAAQSCAPFAGCDGNRCSTKCKTDGDCASGNVCTAGSCGKRPVGSVCSRNDECAGPGVCAQGRCCATACKDSCMACNLEGQLGSCQPVPVGGADPNGTCRNDACNNGCDGKGSCRREKEGTVCGGAMCAPGGTATISRLCTAGGECAEITSSCPAGQICRDNRCAVITVDKKEPGETCALATDCESGACVSGRCCAGSCTGSCRSCDAGSQWRCVDRANDSSCGSKQVCQAGRCVDQCPAKQLRCGDECVDPNITPQHCGGCDRACDKTAPVCLLGKCVPDQSSLPPPAKPDAGN